MLENFFNPASVAILGASNEEGKVGHAVMKNMLESGYGGKIYPLWWECALIRKVGEW